MIRAVIFDLDGVLVDSEPLNFAVLRDYLAEHGVRYTEEDNAAFLGVTDAEHFRALRAAYGLASDEATLVAAYTARLLTAIPGGTVPRPGMPGVLDDLRAGGRRLALASSGSRAVVMARLAALGVTGSFEVVVTAADVEQGKPAPDVFLEAARRLGIAPAACLVVEDAPNGILAARAAGMRCVALACPALPPAALPAGTILLPGLADLPAAIAALDAAGAAARR